MATAMQLATPDRMRGRILGLYSFTLSLSPLGGLVTGTVATLLNTPLAVALSGAVVIAGALGLYRGIDALDFPIDNARIEREKDGTPSLSGGASTDISTPD